MKIEVKYIGHSGFSVALENHYLLFDYFYGELPGNEINDYKYPIVFSSHSHSDHFNKKIFTLANRNPSVRYFLSDDIKKEHENAVYMKPGDVFRQKDVEVYALESTDIGVSFAVMCEGITIFHAGDLNYWSWKNESTEAEIKQEYDRFDNALKEISKQFTDFDIAMFPVDPRLKKDYDEGAFIFLDRIYCTHFFPMHFGTRINAAHSFKKKYDGDTIVHAPDETGQIFTINI